MSSIGGVPSVLRFQSKTFSQTLNFSWLEKFTAKTISTKVARLLGCLLNALNPFKFLHSERLASLTASQGETRARFVLLTGCQWVPVIIRQVLYFQVLVRANSKSEQSEKSATDCNSGQTLFKHLRNDIHDRPKMNS